jgi:predicted small lipoprotein YifL
MKTGKVIAAHLLLSTLAACGGPGPDATVPQAEPAAASNVDIGDHIVHFSALSTDQLPPEVARAYNIVRSQNRAMLNVSIIEEGSNKPVTAEVSVKTVNLTGQLKNVTMRMIREQEAIYYIGETPVANGETLVFDISVQPEGADEASDIRFKRQFYTN